MTEETDVLFVFNRLEIGVGSNEGKEVGPECVLDSPSSGLRLRNTDVDLRTRTIQLMDQETAFLWVTYNKKEKEKSKMFLRYNEQCKT